MSVEVDLLKRLLGKGVDCHSHRPHLFFQPISLDGPNPITQTPAMRTRGLRIDPSVVIQDIELTPFFKTHTALGANGSPSVEDYVFVEMSPVTRPQHDFALSPTAPAQFEDEIKEGGFNLITWLSHRKDGQKLRHYHLYQKPPLSSDVTSLGSKLADKIGQEQTRYLLTRLSQLLPTTSVTSTTGLQLLVAESVVFDIFPIRIGAGYSINKILRGDSQPSPDGSWVLYANYPYQLKVSPAGCSFRYVAATVVFADNGVYFKNQYLDKSTLDRLGNGVKAIYVIPGVDFCSLSFREIDKRVRKQIRAGSLSKGENFKGIVRPTFVFATNLQD